MLLRVQTRIGMARIEVEVTDTLQNIANKLQTALPTLPQFKLSRDPQHKGPLLYLFLCSLPPQAVPQHPPLMYLKA